MAAIMVVGVLGTSFVPDADALKSKNGASSNTDVCGLMLCSDYPGGKTAYYENWSNEYRGFTNVSVNEHFDDHDTSENIPFAHNVDEEFPAQLDEVIHKFELDKISAEQALDGIKEVYDEYVNARIANDIINSVGDKLNLYKKGTFDAATAVEAIHLTAEPQNVDPEYQGALDEVIHKFELDKISAEQALDGIKEAHYGFVDIYITSEIIEAVEGKIVLIDSGKLSGADAVEAIHLTAEPQNVDPELASELDEVIHKFESDKISADDAMNGITEVYDGFVGLTITSDIIEDVGEKIALYNSGKLSGADAVEAIHLTAEPQNVDPELASELDEVIHKFELDKISADDAMNGITEVYDGFVGLTITSDIIEDVGEKIALYNSGKLSGADAVEAIHLTAEPQNVDPEFINAVEEYTYQLELNDISLNEAFEGVTEVYDGFVGLTITSELIEDVGIQLAVYDSGRVSMEFTLEEIEEIIEEAERACSRILF